MESTGSFSSHHAHQILRLPSYRQRLGTQRPRRRRLQLLQLPPRLGVRRDGVSPASPARDDARNGRNGRMRSRRAENRRTTTHLRRVGSNGRRRLEGLHHRRGVRVGPAVAFAATFGFASLASGTDVGAAAGSLVLLVGSLVSFALGLAVAYVVPAVNLNYGEKGRVSAGFAVGDLSAILTDRGPDGVRLRVRALAGGRPHHRSP